MAFFFKQWGGVGADGVRRSKKANGRVFQGRLWDDARDACSTDFCHSVHVIGAKPPVPKGKAWLLRTRIESGSDYANADGIFGHSLTAVLGAVVYRCTLEKARLGRKLSRWLLRLSHYNSTSSFSSPSLERSKVIDPLVFSPQRKS